MNETFKTIIKFLESNGMTQSARKIKEELSIKLYNFFKSNDEKRG